MTEDNSFKQLTQKLGLCQTEEVGGTWLDKNKTVVVVIAMVAVPILLFKSYCYFSNKDKNKMDDKRKEMKIMQKDDKKNVKEITQEDDKMSEREVKQEEDDKNEKKFRQVLLKKNEESKQEDDKCK